MDRDIIIRLAREAGLYVGTNMSGVQLVGTKEDGDTLLCHITAEDLERFAALVAAERDKDIKRLAKALKQAQKVNDELISIMSGSTDLAVRLAVKAERKRICEMLRERHKQEERHNYYGFIANMIEEMP